MNDEADKMFAEMSKQQGYVPKDCYLDGLIVFALVGTGVDPCEGCNLDRNICHGRGKAGVRTPDEEREEKNLRAVGRKPEERWFK